MKMAGKETKRKAKPQTSQKKRMKKTPLLMLAVLFGLLALYVNQNAKLNELTRQNSTYEKQLNLKKEETMKLDIKLEQQTNLGEIERRARELGLVKIEKYNIQYINYSEGDKSIILKSDKKQGGTFFEDVAKAFSVILEYLS